MYVVNYNVREVPQFRMRRMFRIQRDEQNRKKPTTKNLKKKNKKKPVTMTVLARNVASTK